MNEIIPFKPQIEILTQEYWRCDSAEKNAAANYIQRAIDKGKVLREIKESCDYGEWGRWCRDNHVSRQNAWNYMELAAGEESLKKLSRGSGQATTSINQALQILQKERKLAKEAEDFQDKIKEAAKGFMKSLVRMREFLEENPDAEFDVDPEFIFAIDEAKIALDGLNERMKYERSTEQNS